MKNPLRLSPEEPHSPRYYRSLRRAIAVIIILVSLTPLVLVAAISSSQFRESYEAKVLEQLREVVLKHQQLIDFFLREKRGEVRSLARSTSFDDLCAPGRLGEELQLLQEEMQGVFVDLGVVDAQGRQRAYAGPFQLGEADYSGADWFREAARSEVFISDVFLGLRGLPHFIIAVRQRRGDEHWILRATIDFVAFNSLVESIRIGRTGTAYIVNGEGRFQTPAPRGAALPDTGWLAAQLGALAAPAAPAPGFGPALVQGTDAGVVSVVERADPQGADTIYVMAPLKEGRWLLVYQQARADAYATLHSARRNVLVVLGLGAAAIVVMGLWLSARVVRSIEAADTERAMMNEQVIEAGKMASVGELAAGIAHEINNPVAIMLEEAGWVGDVCADLELPEAERADIEKSLAQIRTQGRRCREITHKLLSFARKIDPVARPLDVNAVVSEVVGLSEKRARYSGVDLSLSLAPELPPVLASPSEMQQVLLNLINNAVDAMSQRGGLVQISTRREGDEVVLGVADQGEGIPKANLARIFEPFFTTKPVGKGTGLGLSIVYGIVQKMGGDIEVQSQQHEGTTFLVRLPAGEARQ
jgi:two-component system NtrC family sensor kinase